MSTNDLERLEEFFLISRVPEKPVLIMPAVDLLNEEKLLHLMNIYSPLIQAKERPEVAAIFISWYACVCAALHHMMFHWNDAVLDVSFSNLTVHLVHGESYPEFLFLINNNNLYREIPVEGRGAWVKKELDSFYREQVTPLVQVLARAARMNPILVWGQIVDAAYDQLEEELDEVTEEERRQAILDHFQTRLMDIDASAFGLPKNPFATKRRYIEHPENPDHTMALKTACCLAYRIPFRESKEFIYCYTCPRLKENERALMKAAGQY
ncbi:(2Fe-2S)-binding protein [Paenibacillus sp. CF384]|uniref:(2Fe-2S)-binding protein n=1 Tax=Paenibacillus sp. CF384 TaxID=1884382 RepID=UPI00089C77DD|nr:(2Fe-2S)-binding protein [Paenibacillus sp. CF384]SDX71189.1 Ferric iron reductase protein FhuF, involved in iron transport [Paenibacillus sp. CF384]